MNEKPAPFPTPEDLAPEHQAAEQLVAAVQSAIGGIQERLPNLAAEGPDSKWSVSDLIRLLDLRTQLQGERPRIVRAYWVDDPRDPLNNNLNDHRN